MGSNPVTAQEVESREPKVPPCICSACNEAPGSEPGSGQHLLVGASLCGDCFMEWYDCDRPEAHKNNTPEAIGEWVRRKRCERQGIPTVLEGAFP